MSKIALVITTNPASAPLPPEHPARLSQACRALETRWLADGQSYEVILERPPFADHKQDAPRTASEFASALGLPADPSLTLVDLNIVSTDRRRKKLLVADMESTIIEQECLDELASEVGLHDQVSQITEQAMAGELDFEAALRERVHLLRGLEIEKLQDLLHNKITLMPGAEALVATMRANGAHCALVSGGFTWFTSRIAERLGFHSHQANELIIEDGKLTGEVRDPILGRAAKKAALEQLCEELHLTADDVVAVGDGANDLDMLQAAGLGVAFRAKPIVAETAPHRINHGDLTALLHLQGYERSAFVTSSNNGT